MTPSLLIFIVLTAQSVSPAQIPKKLLPARPPASKILATVNGAPIRASDIEGLLWDWRASEVANDLVGYMVVEQAARKAGVTVRDSEVEAAMVSVARQARENPSGGGASIDLREQGFPDSRLFLRTKADLLLTGLALKDFQAGEFVKISTILIKPKNEQTPALGEAIRRADDAYAKLQAGRKWEEVLAENPDDPNALRNAGLVGWRRLAAFPEGVRAELTSLKPGEVTKPAQTANGFQIFRLEARGAGSTAAQLEEIKGIYLAGVRPTILQKLREEAKIQRF